ncbi:chorismate-binding protein [Adhaeribacter sp. BT258]|uniref:Chorismate-binding protein n=2 Tax=Adhaeribacter terrigena TaxID=2793070 RepID=A0ABS1C5S9_9BACT|nr:chorismate-binding protein [Adhaeribacter terrigena]MBK0404742.1 chorismate-binding protein [Adhaeribacter terrigena]
MHPFSVSGKNLAYFLKADLLFEADLKAEEISGDNLTDSKFAEEFLSTLKTELLTPETDSNWHVADSDIQATSRSDFEALVENAILFIKKSEAEKIVPSRTAQQPLPPHFSPVAGFINLTQQYPLAFVSLVSASKIGTWLGASPEILVQKDRHNIFKTMALAGTQKLVSGQNAADAIWRQKEIEEQSMVVRYIISCFKKIRLREYVETGPRTAVAGNLLHLRSDFCVNLNEQPDFPTLTSDMLHLLHPTSAVCGQPKAAALDFLHEHENYDRKYYSGYLGPVNVNAETAIFVNLRCLELQKNEAILYAGAGVTQDSDPQKEWLETELKMQTVAKALQILPLPDDTATGY